ncbi:proline transporter 2 [Citrus sinensis]|uniref:Proline transporter 2 n=1 Tax=Citrus sinensis TaxID=2711 RepID=A0ACB8LSK1_CITSI|nr:proline transporter 2 [Citrus sinensis]
MEGTNNVAAALIIEEGQTKGSQNQESGATSAHTVGHDSWQQMGFMLVIVFNCGYILSFSNLILVPLGWKWGILCMFFLAFYSLYSQWLLSAFHFIDGKRFIRYRDLMGYLYGREMYYYTWAIQYLTLLVANIGFIVLAARSLKEINMVFSDSPVRLQIYILISGLAFFIFANLVPTMSAIRRWLAVSFIITFTYVLILLVILVRDGTSNKSRDYEIQGSKTDKIYNAIGAMSAIIVANAAGMIPEMQSTLRQPAVMNMRKALYSQYTVGLLFYYGVTIIGYWAYGSSVSVYLPEQIGGAKWIKVFVNAAVFLQSLVSQHAKAKASTIQKKAWHWFNILFFTLVTIATTVAAVRNVVKHIQDYSFFADA